MPAVSQAQQKAAGMALAAKRGKIHPSKLQGASKEMYDSMSDSDLSDFASTESARLPYHVEERLREYIKKTIQEVLNETELNEDDKWIQKAVNPAHKGDCTPMTKKTCTPRKKALAKRFKAGIENEGQIDEASFSRQHYIAIAEAIRDSKSKATVAYRLADIFEKDNQLFDREKFLNAAGIFVEK